MEKPQKSLTRIKKTITPDYHDYLLIKYLKILQPTWTKLFAIKMIRTKNVLINNQRTTVDYRLQMGDRLEFYGSTSKTKEKNLNLKKLKPLQVIFENANVIIVNKEKNIAVQPDEKNLYNNMNNRLLNHLNYEQNREKWKPTFIHRLDFNTTGLLIGAKTFKAFQELTKALQENKINKYYKALVKDLVKFKEITIKNRLQKQGNMVHIVPPGTPQSREAVTEVKLLKHYFETSNSLLELKLVTGRTHQIRVHMQSINHPIRGDQKYGIEKDKKTFPCQALTAYKISFNEQITGQSIKELRGKTFEIKDIWFEKLA